MQNKNHIQSSQYTCTHRYARIPTYLQHCGWKHLIYASVSHSQFLSLAEVKVQRRTPFGEWLVPHHALFNNSLLKGSRCHGNEIEETRAGHRHHAGAHCRRDMEVSVPAHRADTGALWTETQTAKQPDPGGRQNLSPVSLLRKIGGAERHLWFVRNHK